MNTHTLCKDCGFKKKCPKKRFEIVVNGKTMWVCYRQFLQIILAHK